MDRERPFLDPEITLPSLAQAMDIPAAHLSPRPERAPGKEFLRVHQRYRVGEAQKRLAGQAPPGTN